MKNSIKTFCSAISFRTRLLVWLCAGVSAGLGIYSSVCPPKGVIDKSIIEFAWALSIYPLIIAVFEAIQEGLTVKYKRGDTSVEIGDKEDGNGEV